MTENNPVAKNLPPLSDEELAALDTAGLKALIQELGKDLNTPRTGSMAFAWADKYRNRVFKELGSRG